MAKNITFTFDNEDTTAVKPDGSPDLAKVMANDNFKYSVKVIADKFSNLGYGNQAVPIFGDAANHKSALIVYNIDEQYITEAE